jgi:ABC-type methionine transport system permease subunit
LALAVICVSVYIQGALGRFTELLRRSILFLIGSLALAPLTHAIAGTGERANLTFMVLMAALFVGVACLHLQSLRRLRASL